MEISYATTSLTCGGKEFIKAPRFYYLIGTRLVLLGEETGLRQRVAPLTAPSESKAKRWEVWKTYKLRSSESQEQVTLRKMWYVQRCEPAPGVLAG